MAFRQGTKISTLDEFVEIKELIPWGGMIPFTQEYREAPYQLELVVKSKDDVQELVNLLGDDYKSMMAIDEILRAKKSYWYPILGKEGHSGGKQYQWIEEE